MKSREQFWCRALSHPRARVTIALALVAIGCSGADVTGHSPDPQLRESVCRVQGPGECGVAVPLTCSAAPELADLAQAMGTADADCWQPDPSGLHWCCLGRTGSL